MKANKQSQFVSPLDPLMKACAKADKAAAGMMKGAEWRQKRARFADLHAVALARKKMSAYEGARGIAEAHARTCHPRAWAKLTTAEERLTVQVLSRDLRRSIMHKNDD